MFEEHGLGYYGAEAAASCKTGGGREEMDEKDHEIAHFRILTTKRKLAEFLAISNSPGTPERRKRPLGSSRRAVPRQTSGCIRLCPLA